MYEETFISRAELAQRVEQFEVSLPGLLRSNPEEELFRATLTMVADSLVEDTRPEDRSWAIDRFNELLESAGQRPLDYELTRSL